jgi:predicted component of viral defense system (DUF524 family)
VKTIPPEKVLSIVYGRKPDLVAVLVQIAERPHRELVVDTPLVEMEGLTEPDTERFLDLVVDPGALSIAKQPPIHVTVDDRKYQFTRVYDKRPRVTFDTYPNRFVCHVIRRLRDALMSSGKTGEAADLARRLQGLVRASSLQEAGAIHHVSADHNVLRKDPLYREVLRCSTELTRLFVA